MTATSGHLWFDTSDNSLKTWDGENWVEIGDFVTHRWTLEMMRDHDDAIEE